MHLVRSIAAFLFLASATLVAASAVSCNSACQPASGSSCTRGQNIPLNFFVTAPVQGTSVNSTNSTLSTDVITYPYCAQVDQLQAFDFPNITQFAGQNFPFTGSQSYVYLALGGTGPGTTESRMPLSDMDGAVPFIEWDSDFCSGGPAVVQFLVLNLTMTNGLYVYGGPSNGAIQVGFSPTCSGDTCLVGGSNSFCIGQEGRKNCAVCAPTQSTSLNVKVFASYYGTDSSGRSFSSGTLNPLSSSQFSWDPAYTVVSNDVLS